MPRVKVEKYSISVPASQAAHVRMMIAEEGLKGVSDYFQKLIAEDIRKTKRRALKSTKESTTIRQGLDEAEKGQLVTLDPTTLDLIVQQAISRIMEASGERNTDIRKGKKGDT